MRVHPQCFSPQHRSEVPSTAYGEVTPYSPFAIISLGFGKCKLGPAVLKGAAVTKAVFPSGWVESERQPAIHPSLL